jgi:hypothetical protein
MADRVPPMIIFLVLGAVAVASSILVVAMRNPVHSALFLLLTFLCVAILFILGARGVRRRGPAARLRRRHHGPVPLRGHADQRPRPAGETMLSPFWKAGVGVGIARVPRASSGRSSGEVSSAVNVSRRAPKSDDPTRLRRRRPTVPRLGRPTELGKLRGDRDGALSGLPGAVRGRLALPARRDDRRDRHRQAPAARANEEEAVPQFIRTASPRRSGRRRPSVPSTDAYLLLSATMFSIGLVGSSSAEHHRVLMCVELMLNAVNINFVAFAIPPRRASRGTSSRSSSSRSRRARRPSGWRSRSSSIGSETA